VILHITFGTLPLKLLEYSALNKRGPEDADFPNNAVYTNLEEHNSFLIDQLMSMNTICIGNLDAAYGAGQCHLFPWISFSIEAVNELSSWTAQACMDSPYCEHSCSLTKGMLKTLQRGYYPLTI